jgi:hypothetical protein
VRWIFNLRSQRRFTAAPWRRSVWLAGMMLATAGWAATPPADDFSPLVKMAPFVVQGKQLTISVHARSNGDRRYAQGFAEEVIKVVYESVTPETGKGLVIIGAKGEPHPIVFFRKFLALADAGKLDPAIAARGPELNAMLDHWRNSVDADSHGRGKTDEGADLGFDKIITALPLPLDGFGARLYQLAWKEKFDDARVEARLLALRPGDLEQDLFTRFDWVFYLPPKNAFDHVLDELVSDALKQDDAGFFARTAVRGVMLVVKPKIRRAIEAVRQGLLFQTVVQARTHLTEPEVTNLTGAYIEVLLPNADKAGGSEHERAVQAVRQRLQHESTKIAGAS